MRTLSNSQRKAMFARLGKGSFLSKGEKTHVYKSPDTSDDKFLSSLNTPGSGLRNKIAKILKTSRKSPTDSHGIGLRVSRTGNYEAFVSHPTSQGRRTGASVILK